LKEKGGGFAWLSAAIGSGARHLLGINTGRDRMKVQESSVCASKTMAGETLLRRLEIISTVVAGRGVISATIDEHHRQNAPI